MAKTAVPELTPTHDEIAAQAYEIYLREGCVPGRDLDHWLQAEQEIRARNGGNNGEIHTLASATTVAPPSHSHRPNSRHYRPPVHQTLISALAPILIKR